MKSSLHAIREQMNLRGGSFVQQLSQLMLFADAENMNKIVTAFPDIMELYDTLASVETQGQQGPASTRYFTDDYDVWKFEPGKPPMRRASDETSWHESDFASLAEFEESPGYSREIASEGGEP